MCEEEQELKEYAANFASIAETLSNGIRDVSLLKITLETKPM